LAGKPGQFSCSTGLDLQPGGLAGHDGVAVVARAGLFKGCRFPPFYIDSTASREMVATRISGLFSLPRAGATGADQSFGTQQSTKQYNYSLTIAVGFGHFGTVANHEANGVWGITTKWEF
jgi:hypothetical protein